MKKLVLSFLAACLSFTVYAQKDSIALQYSKYINAKQISKYMNKLVSEEFAGRETGEKGLRLAAEYIASEFKKSGALPGNNGSYYQYYDLKFSETPSFNVNINRIGYDWLKDYYTYYKISDQILNKDTMLFLGYGIESEKWNDIKNLNLKDKILLVLEKEPKDKKGNYFISGNKKRNTQVSGGRAKISKLKEHSPAAIFVVTNDIQKNIKRYEQWINRKRAELIKTEESEDELTPPVLFISKTMADQMMISKNISVEKLEKQMQKKKKPITFYTTSDVKVSISNNDTIKKAENVVATVVGNENSEEWIVITAHFDHLGEREEGIFYGADDNASGTAGVIMMAHAFAQMVKDSATLKRNILFMLVSGEEKGLLGSSYYVNDPVVPLENTVCNLNIDMIGRIDEEHEGNEDYVYLIGSDRLSKDLHNLSERVNKTYSNLELDYTFNDRDDPNRFYERSDHYNFAKNNIPVIFYFNGVHDDYHKVTDTIDKISFSKVEKISKLIFYTAYEAANRESRIQVDVKQLQEDEN